MKKYKAQVLVKVVGTVTVLAESMEEAKEQISFGKSEDYNVNTPIDVWDWIPDSADEFEEVED